MDAEPLRTEVRSNHSRLDLYPTNVYIDHVDVEGLPDDTTGFGYNVNNGIIYTGELPRSPAYGDLYFLSGSYTVRNSAFKSMGDGVSQDGFITSSRITVGGSPGAGNHFEDCGGGIDIEASQKSVIEISYNESSGVWAGMWVVPWAPFFVPSSPSRYLIHDNKFYATNQYAEGMYLSDNPSNPWIQAQVWNNTIEVQNSLSEGFGVFNTKGTVAWSNTIIGSDGFDAIGLYGSTLDTLIGNNVSGFTTQGPDFVQIYLDPSTSRDFVVCAEPSDTFLDQGTNNIIVGCQQLGTTQVAASRNLAIFAPASRPLPHMRKPSLFKQ